MDMKYVREPDYDEAERQSRLAYVQLTERDQACLREIADWIGPQLDDIVADFYGYLSRFESTRRVFRDDAQISRLKETQKAYLLRTLRGPYDADYFRERWRIGEVHNRVSVEPQWYLGAYQLYRRILFPRLQARYQNDVHALGERLLALDKIMTVDMVVGLDSYWAHYNGAMESMRALNAEIRAASEAKSQFLANMSHEFRTPLNAILGFAEVLQDELAGPLNARQMEYVEDIHHAGQMLLRLINDLLDLAKIEAGRLELFYETFSVAQAVREAVTIVRGAAEKKSLAIKVSLPSELGPIHADPIRFKQVLHNLLSNAVKFTEQGGITLTASIEADDLHLVVEDTGVGIREEDMGRIFREFSQLDASHTRRYEGTGLGLALTKRLVDAHGGRIWVESRFGQGSAFHLLLPLRPPMVTVEGSP